MEEQSLWLTTSINVPDPLKTNDDLSLPSMKVNTVQVPATQNPDQSSMRAFRQSSVRHGSVGSTSLITLHEYDELRNRVSQLNREKRLWEDTERALDRMKVEVENLRQENASLTGVIGTLRSTNAAANKRAETDARQREEAESKLAEFMLKAAQDYQAVKLQMGTAVATAEANLREEISRRCSQVDEMKSDHMRQIADLSSQVSLTQDLLDRRTEEFDKLQEGTMELREKLHLANQHLVNESQTVEKLQQQLLLERQDHDEKMQTVKVLTDEQLHSLKADVTSMTSQLSNVTEQLRTTESKVQTLLIENELLRKSERDISTKLADCEKAATRAAEEYSLKLTSMINDYQRSLEDERRTATAFNEQISRLQDENRAARDQATAAKAALSHN